MSEEALEAQARRDLYALCARLFAAEVDPPLLEALTTEPVDGLFQQMELTLIDEPLLRRPRAELLDALAAEYCRLFIGPQPLCPPYASAWRGEALLGGRARARLEAFLDRHELSLSEHLMRLASADHIAVELSVLSVLHDAIGEGEAHPPAVREFLEQHLLPWGPAWLAQVEAGARLPFYRSAAALTRTLLEEERHAYGL